MSFQSSPRIYRRLRVALCVLFLCCLSSPANSYAQDLSRPEILTLDIRISVADQDTGRPIPGAQILIPRRVKAKGRALLDLKGVTDSNGEFARSDIDFPLAGAPNNLIVTAPDYKTVELELPDAVLRESFNNNKSLHLAVALTRSNVSFNAPTPVSATERPERNFTEWILASMLRSVLTWLGLVVFALGLVALWHRYLRPRHAMTVARSEPGHERISAKSNEMYLKRIDERLARLESLMEEDRKQLGILTQALKEIHGLVSKVFISVKDEPRQHYQPVPAAEPPPGVRTVKQLREWLDAALPLSPVMKAQIPVPEEAKPDTLRERSARAAYLKLLNKEPLEAEPLYLENEGKSSVSGKPEDNSIYLSQVSHRQATFVLFIEDEKTGWLFPNPRLAYLKPFRKVFSDLTEEQFNSSKEQIEPVRASRVEDRRWKIEE